MNSTPDDVVPEVATEAIVVVDLVESTSTSNLFGWYGVGRQLMRELRVLIHDVGHARGLRCVKSTGDGYLLSFRDDAAAANAAILAEQASFDLLDQIEIRNRSVPEERTMNLRIALHFGEVDVIENDREGPHVAFTFRLEAISRASLQSAMNPIDPDQLPLKNYVLCSEEVSGIVSVRDKSMNTLCIGFFRLKGFPGWREVYQLSHSST